MGFIPKGAIAAVRNRNGQQWRADWNPPSARWSDGDIPERFGMSEWPSAVVGKVAGQPTDILHLAIAGRSQRGINS